MIFTHSFIVYLCMISLLSFSFFIFFKFGSFSFDYYPFVMHGFLVSLFSSLIGPFGGFLASGLKRACRQKNFGSLIPGHGGVLDRCDCMFLMAVFSYVYLETLKQAEIM